jgi:hypothetical protein
VPLQVALFPAQLPELVDTNMPMYVPAAGVDQFGAPVQLRPLLTATPLQVTAGGVIAVPAVPDVGTLAQVSVYVIWLELLGTPIIYELLLGTTALDEETAAVLLLETPVMVTLLQVAVTLVAPGPQLAVALIFV